MRRSFLYTIFWLLCTSSLSAKEVVVAISSKPNNLNPFFSIDYNSQNINRLAHQALIEVNDRMASVCLICDSFEVVNGDFGQKLFFSLKAGLKFWDGESLDAAAVKKSIELYQSDDVGSIFRFAFRKIKKVEILSPRRLVLHYEKVSKDNVSDLNLLKLVKLEGKEVIGAGEYRYIEEKSQDIIIEKVNDSSKRIRFKIVSDETTLALKFLNNEIDLTVSSMSPRKINFLKEKLKNEFKIYDRASTNFNYLSVNFLNPLMKDKRMRLALEHAIDRKAIIQHKLKNTAVISSGLFSPSFVQYYVPREVRSFNPGKSQELLRELGYKKVGPYFQKNGKTLSLNILAPNKRSSIEFLEVIKMFLEKVGIKTQILQKEWGSYLRDFKAGKFDLCLGSWVGFTGPEMLNSIFATKSFPKKGRNRGRFSNKRVDTLLEQASGEIDPKKKWSYYKDVLELVDEEIAYLNLWHPKIVWLGRSCMNLKVLPNGSFLSFQKSNLWCEK